MKKCKHITCWTDYPFAELGDEAYKPAPIRHVNIVSYDGDKYVKVSFENCGDVLEVKSGYLYSQPGRFGQVKNINMRKLERMGDGKIARQNDRWRKKFAQLKRKDLERETRIWALMRKEKIGWREAWEKILWEKINKHR